MKPYDEDPEATALEVVTKYNEQLAASHKERIFAHMEDPDTLTLRGKKYGIKLHLQEWKDLPKEEIARKMRQTCRRLARW